MPTILIVDDSPIDLQLSAELFRKSDAWTVHTACNGVRALETLEQVPVDVLLTDLVMPAMGGLELLAAVRASHGAVPVVVTTSFGSEETAVAAMQSGAASYVSKRHLAATALDVCARVHEVAREQESVDRVGRGVVRVERSIELPTRTDLIHPAVRYLQEMVEEVVSAGEQDRIRLGVALVEALTNAMIHGNLAVGSELRGVDDAAYKELVAERQRSVPYRDRVVRIDVEVTPDEACFAIRDEGNGFDPTTLPDPTDPENLALSHGRGILLMRWFMDEVIYGADGRELILVKHVASDAGISRPRFAAPLRRNPTGQRT